MNGSHVSSDLSSICLNDSTKVKNWESVVVRAADKLRFSQKYIFQLKQELDEKDDKIDSLIIKEKEMKKQL